MIRRFSSFDEGFKSKKGRMLSIPLESDKKWQSHISIKFDLLHSNLQFREK